MSVTKIRPGTQLLNGDKLESLSELDYFGNALKVVRVNAGEDDFELATVAAVLDTARLSLPNVFLDVNTFPGIRLGVVNVTDDYEITATDFEVVANALANPFEVTLPDALGTGQIYRIKKIDASPNTVTLTPQAGDLIDGAGGVTLSAQYDGCIVQDIGIGVWEAWTIGVPSNVALRDQPNTFTDVNFFNGIRFSPQTVTSDYALTKLDVVVEVDATTGPVEVLLPASAGNGQYYRIKKIDASANIVTLQAAGTDLIDDTISVNLADQFAECSVIDAATGYWDNILPGGEGGGGAFIGLSDVPSSYSGQTLKVVRVNAGETGLEFVVPEGTNIGLVAGLAIALG